MAARRSFKRIRGPPQLLLLLLLPWGLVVSGQNITIIQHPEKISVEAGDNLTLQCTLSGVNIPGSVRWYKGRDRSQTPIYSDKQGASNRGVRVIPGDNADFSIIIQNVRPEDDGTYFCVKFRAEVPERELVLGKGTLVYVIDSQKQLFGVLCTALFLSKVAILLIFCLFLVNVRGHRRTRSRPGTSQEQ
ncbi:tyrosine-protein phosphatase non-receptor type substrate 1-like [Erythrolamprus reginae]|uniref:tyrosine-protein phosphatase non-receptor type substrate 1-like n=1 Tax=Erythrolamprus reginae TaxID=121349 RepID=UPI00396C2FFB